MGCIFMGEEKAILSLGEAMIWHRHCLLEMMDHTLCYDASGGSNLAIASQAHSHGSQALFMTDLALLVRLLMFLIFVLRVNIVFLYLLGLEFRQGQPSKSIIENGIKIYLGV